MDHDAVEFRKLIGALLRRYFAQNGQPSPSESACDGLADRLYAAIAAHGLPPKLAPGDPGAPGGLAEGESAALVAQVLGERSVTTAPDSESQHELLAEAAKQLVKTCFYPEFTVCRDSYRERKKDGSCKRQNLERVRGRLSGTHCVDCPYWQSLEAEPHRQLLAAAWCGPAEELDAERAIFLPEDFRKVRRWVRARAPAAAV